VLSFFSSRRNWDSPTPLAAGECAPPPFGPGGRAHSKILELWMTLGHTRLRERGWVSPNTDEATYTMVLYIFKYFVVDKIFGPAMPRRAVQVSGDFLLDRS
jgi:hypothetical protein